MARAEEKKHMAGPDTSLITVWGEGRGFRVVWLLEEMRLPYRLRPVDLLRDLKDDPEFLAINPAGFIPALEDGGAVMVESIAIMQYLMARHGPTPLAPDPQDPAFPAYLLGEGRPRDPVKGMAVCAELPHNNAVFMFAGAYDYQNGLSGPKDEDTARNLYALATKAGSGEAADAMGQYLLAEGKADMARQWFRRGVYLGSPDAMDHLAQMVEAGQGGPADADEAGWLYEHAALRGNVHAQGQPKSAHLLSACMADNGTEMAITHTYSDKSGPHTETVTLDRLISLLTRSFSTWVNEATIEGSATITCHIAADHTLDACILEREFPQRAGYGQTLEAVFNGHISVADQDALSRPTAHRRLALAVNWKVSR
jgi:glutathione S-transferase